MQKTSNIENAGKLALYKTAKARIACAHFKADQFILRSDRTKYNRTPQKT